MNLVPFLRQTPTIHPGIRGIITRDYPVISGIDQAAYVDPWSVKDIGRVLKQRNVIGNLIEDDGRIKGYVIYEFHADRIEILRLAVDPAWQLRGVGRRLIAKLVGKLTEEGRSRLEIRVREGNLDGQIFLRNRGFRATKVIRGHFRDTGEDAYTMEFTCE